jgi:uncharacterized membrane protein
VVVAIVLVLLFGFTALAIDIGRAYEERRGLQNAADLAAISGAQRLMEGTAQAVAAGSTTSARTPPPTTTPSMRPAAIG